MPENTSQKASKQALKMKMLTPIKIEVVTTKKEKL